MNVNVYRGNPEFLRKKWSLYAEVPIKRVRLVIIDPHIFIRDFPLTVGADKIRDFEFSPQTQPCSDRVLLRGEFVMFECKALKKEITPSAGKPAKGVRAESC